MDIRAFLGRLRAPEYTGSNRCRPCTLLNGMVIGVSIGVVLLVLRELGVAWLPSIGISLVLSVVGVAALYLRGYVVPGTPELTARYLPAAVRARLGKDGSGAADPDGNTPSARLAAADILDFPDPDEPMGVTATFREEVNRLATQMEDLDAADAIFGDMLAIPTTELWRREFGGACKILAGGKLVGKWTSSARYQSQMAMVAAVRDRIDEWAELPPSERVELVAEVRRRDQGCQECDAPLTIVRTSCCGGTAVTRLECERCDTVDAEYRAPGAASTS